MITGCDHDLLPILIFLQRKRIPLIGGAYQCFHLYVNCMTNLTEPVVFPNEEKSARARINHEAN